MLNIILFCVTEILCLILGYGWGRHDERKAQKEKDKHND